MSNFCSARNGAPIEATLYIDSSFNIDDVLSDLHSMPVISFFNATYSAKQRDRRSNPYSNYMHDAFTRVWTDCAADSHFSPPSYGYDIPPLPTLFDMDTGFRRDRGSGDYSVYSIFVNFASGADPLLVHMNAPTTVFRGGFSASHLRWWSNQLWCHHPSVFRIEPVFSSYLECKNRVYLSR